MILALAVMLGAGAALADDLYVGGNYNWVPLDVGDKGGGSITVSTLNGVTQPWVYCVDLYTDIYVPGDYNNTIVTNNGAVNGNNVNNAGAVAWLLDEFAHSDIGNTNGQVALQAAIWHEIYGVGLNSSSAYYNATIGADYAYYLNKLGSNTASVATVNWFSPGITGDNTVYQGLAGHVPDGGMTLMLLGGTMSLLRLCAGNSSCSKSLLKREPKERAGTIRLFSYAWVRS